tara:strand:+ start:55 stop:309 length:255 start_codon:yes stop_codon:yes gene_type:complete
LKKIKKNTIIIENLFNNKIINHILKKYPEMSSGRKRYLEKEYNISEDICLSKLSTFIRKNKIKNIQSISIKRLKNKTVLRAKIK